MFKRLLAMLSVVVMAFTLVSTTASADVVMLCTDYSGRCRSSLSISGSTATCKSILNGYSGTTTKVVITQILQKKNSSVWSQVKTWSTTVTSYNAAVTKTASSISTGTYRLETIFKIYEGSTYDSVNIYSSTITIS